MATAPLRTRESIREIDWPARFAELARTARHPAVRAYYAGGIVAADTGLADVPFAAVDFETTGLDPRRHSIVSIGIVPFSLKRIAASRSHYRVVRPRRELVGESVTIHNITHEQLENAPDLVEVLPEVLEALSGRVMVVHYRAIERRFLNLVMHDRIGEGLEFPVVDTMEIEAEHHRRGFKARLRHALGLSLPSVRLAASRSRYRLPQYRPHHALTDALATAELFQAQVRHLHDAHTPIGRMWC